MVVKPVLIGAFALAFLASCAEKTRSISDVRQIPTLTSIERQARDSHAAAGQPNQSKALTRRVAVVIGNAAYQWISALENPRNDAVVMAEVLRKNGFHVLEGLDLTKTGFETLLQEAVVQGGPGAEIIVFYAGHGFQIGDKNYLVPVDAKITGPNDLPFQTVQLGSVFRVLNDRSRQHISFLDSCRNNPFEGVQVKTGVGRGTATAQVGFSEPRVPANGFVSYSTQPGAVAFDGEDGPNSPFTSALAKAVSRAPQTPLERTLRSVRRAVQKATGGAQTPTWTSRLSTDFKFAAPKVEIAALSVAPTAGTPTAAPSAVTIPAPRENLVALGGRIADQLDLPPGATVTVADTSTTGAVSVITESGALAPAGSVPLDQSNLGALVYTPPVTQSPSADGAIETAKLDVTVINGTKSETVAVSLAMDADPCDAKAADWLDLQGVGVCSATPSPASEAVLACKAAVTREPQNGRFHYQLAQAYSAAGRKDGLEALYQTALSLGHVRANAALGKLAAAAGDTATARTYFQAGANAGDPVAAAALGILGLKTATTQAEREQAYDQLGFAIDIGLPDAMLALAAYYSDPNSVDFDPERAQVFETNAKARAPRCSGVAAASTAPATATTTANTGRNDPNDNDQPDRGRTEPTGPTGTDTGT